MIRALHIKEIEAHIDKGAFPIELSVRIEFSEQDKVMVVVSHMTKIRLRASKS